MSTLRRLSWAALAVAFTHLVFGAIVRISGSGMGCGDHWPKCYGYWFPPFSRPDLVVEVSHRYLASILVVAVSVLALAAWRRRGEPGVAGRGGVLRTAVGAVVAVLTAAVLGGVTVKMGNAPFATLAHWTVAMTLLATLAATAMRAGALGGARARLESGPASAARGAYGAAAMAFLAVVMGGLTAKYPSAAIACRGFPLCGQDANTTGAAVFIQLAHRTLAFLLVLHLFGMVMAGRKRPGAAVVRTATWVALGLASLQIVVAASMVLLHLPAVLRSLHEAVGVSVWLGTFVLAYLARIASGASAIRAGAPPRSNDVASSRDTPDHSSVGGIVPPPGADLGGVRS